MRIVALGTFGFLLLGFAVVAAAQMPGPTESPGMMAPPTSGDVADMARICVPMMGQMMGMRGMMTGGGMMGSGMMGGMMPWVWWTLQALIFWGLPLAALVTAMLILSRARRVPSAALEILQSRFARGEMSAEEFANARRVL